MYDLFVLQTYIASFVICTSFIDCLVWYRFGTVLIQPIFSTLFIYLGIDVVAKVPVMYTLRILVNTSHKFIEDLFCMM